MYAREKCVPRCVQKCVQRAWRSSVRSGRLGGVKELAMSPNLSSPDRLTEAFGPIITAAATPIADFDDDCIQAALNLRSRQLSNDQLRTLEQHASHIFATSGSTWTRPVRAPRRVA